PVPQGGKGDLVGQVAVIQVDALVKEFFVVLKIQDGNKRAHSIVLGEGQTVAHQAAGHVVLFRGDPGAGTVGSHSDRKEIVGKTAPTVVGVLCRCVFRQIVARDCVQRVRLEAIHFTSIPLRDEAGDPQVGSITRD